MKLRAVFFVLNFYITKQHFSQLSLIDHPESGQKV